MITRFFQRIAAGVKYDYVMAEGLKGYLINRLKEKTTWGAIGASFLAANGLNEPWAAGTVIIAAIVALLPSPSKM